MQISPATKTEGRGVRTWAGAALLVCASLWAAACNGGGDVSEFVADFPFEQCDKGAANTNGGVYDGCTVECVLGARCGDGVKNGPEACDDGNRTNGDGCSAACLVESGGPK